MDKVWLVLFYSMSALKCKERDTACTDVHDKWSAVVRRVSDVGGAKMGIVDCDAHRPWCEKHKVGHMPFVRRYKGGKKKAFYDAWEIDRIMTFIREDDDSNEESMSPHKTDEDEPSPPESGSKKGKGSKRKAK